MDRRLFNPGIYGKHVKVINGDLHTRVIAEIDEPDKTNKLVGPSQAPHQKIRIRDFTTKRRIPKEVKPEV